MIKNIITYTIFNSAMLLILFGTLYFLYKAHKHIGDELSVVDDIADDKVARIWIGASAIIALIATIILSPIS